MMIQAIDMQRRGHVSKQYGAVTCWQNLAIWPQIFCLPKIVFSSLTLFLFPTVFHTSLSFRYQGTVIWILVPNFSFSDLFKISITSLSKSENSVRWACCCNSGANCFSIEKLLDTP